MIMYCSDCGTVNPADTLFCLKCARDLSRPVKQPENEIDAALAARPAGAGRSSGATGLSIGMAALVAIGAVIVIALFVMSLQIKKSKPVLTREKPAVDQSGGFGMEVRDAGAIARDAGKKVNASKARMALEEYFAQNDRYPESLADLDPGALRFVADPAIYKYQGVDGGRDFRLEIPMESNEVSGADVVTEGEITKLVITGSGY